MESITNNIIYAPTNELTLEHSNVPILPIHFAVLNYLNILKLVKIARVQFKLEI